MASQPAERDRLSGDPLLDRLTAALERHAELGSRMAEPEVLGNVALLRDIAREHAGLQPVIQAGQRHLKLLDELAQARELARDSDPDLANLAAAEASELATHLEESTSELRLLLLPADPLDDRPAVVEIRAGTGGDEAALFAADLHRMYERFASAEGWTVETIDARGGTLGGIKEIIFLVRGSEAYGRLRYESGVHRVQRVPETESQGRIHTSAATVAVLPEAEEVDVQIDSADLKIDVFRSSGPGGQSVNTTDSAVRITHQPTGLVVTCQDEKSQHKNKARAMRVLRSRLLDRMVSEQEAARARERRMHVGTGDRSAKIRTYNFPQNRVTDHRIKFTSHRLEAILAGDLNELVEALRLAGMEERLEGGAD